MLQTEVLMIGSAGIEDKLDYLRVFRDLGVRMMQLTYNTQNYSGAGYSELNDSGLTGFGREVVTEMAKLGKKTFGIGPIKGNL